MKVLLTTAFIFLLLTESYSYQIKGTVYNDIYFPLPNIKVFIENGDSTETDIDGRFSVSVIKIPYTITVVSKEKVKAVRYEGLNSTTPRLFLNESISNLNTNTSVLNVSIPALNKNQTAYLHFISKSAYKSEFKTIKHSISQVDLHITWPDKENSLSGYLIYYVKSDIKFISYTLIPVTLNTITNNTSIFISSIDMNSLSTGTIQVEYPSSNTSSGRAFLYVEFPGMGEIELTLKKKDNTASAIVPVNLPLDYKLKAKFFQKSFNDRSGSFTSVRYVSPDNNIFFEEETVPQILSPLDNFASYTPQTLFSYGMDINVGIYAVSFTGKGDFTIITSSKNVKSPIEKSYGILKGEEIKWSVYKMKSYEDVNDYVKETTELKRSEASITHSETISFKFMN